MFISHYGITLRSDRYYLNERLGALELRLIPDTGGIIYEQIDRSTGEPYSGQLWDHAAGRVNEDAISALAARFIPDDISDDQKRKVHATVTADITNACAKLRLIQKRVVLADG